MKRLLFFAVIIASIFIINNLARSIYTLWDKRDLLEKAKVDLEEKKKASQELEGKLEVVQSQEFIESQARNKLLLVKPGEQLVILPSISSTEEDNKAQKKEAPNWQQWWRLFF